MFYFLFSFNQKEVHSVWIFPLPKWSKVVSKTSVSPKPALHLPMAWWLINTHLQCRKVPSRVMQYSAIQGCTIQSMSLEVHCSAVHFSAAQGNALHCNVVLTKAVYCSAPPLLPPTRGLMEPSSPYLPQMIIMCHQLITANSALQS